MCIENQLQKVLSIVAQQAKILLSDRLDCVILFGSYARGDYDGESDIDFAAVVKGERLDLQRKLKAMWDIAADLGMERDVVISPTVIPYSEFIKYKYELPYYRNIIREGLKIE